MRAVDQALLRTLAEWRPASAPVTSIYLSVDGRRFPRKADYELRLDELIRRARELAVPLDAAARKSVGKDLEAVSSFVRERFERGAVRGLAMFSAAAEGLWQALPLPRPVRSRAVVAPEVDILPLEAVLKTYESFCTTLVDYEKARIFTAELGRIEEEEEILDDVPGRHEQGGWAQARFQRHVDDHRQQHLKRVADALFKRFRRKEFDHLILAGSEEVVAELERELHDYLRRRVRAKVALPVIASADQVLARSLVLEEELELEREGLLVRQLADAASSGGHAVTGLGRTLAALAEGRVGRLVVDADLSAPGVVCTGCSALAEWGSTCRVCSEPVEPVRDVVETAVVSALRGGCGVETVSHDGSLAAMGGIGAMLRF